MAAEKGRDIVTDNQRVGDDASSLDTHDQSASAAAFGEAVGVYGNVETAEKLEYVQRGLKSRCLQFMALGGTIGTSLFLGIGGAFLKAGPLSVIHGFSITGIAVFCMMIVLGEMTTWLPLPGAVPQYCARYVDSAMCFAVGWNIFVRLNKLFNVCTFRGCHKPTLCLSRATLRKSIKDYWSRGSKTIVRIEMKSDHPATLATRDVGKGLLEILYRFRQSQDSLNVKCLR